MAGKPLHGGTTVSGTMVLAHLAGIKIFGTGGLGAYACTSHSPSLVDPYTGGVHRGGEASMDISGTEQTTW